MFRVHGRGHEEGEANTLFGAVKGPFRSPTGSKDAKGQRSGHRKQCCWGNKCQMFSSMSPGLFSSSMSYSFHPPERVTPHPGAPSSRLAGICARGRIGGGGGVVRGCDGRTLGGPRGRSLAGDKQRRQMTEEAGLRVDTKGASR